MYLAILLSGLFHIFGMSTTHFGGTFGLFDLIYLHQK